ncbi:MAG: YdbL family protein [Thermodesulfobacteriota bacterium]
MKITAPGLFRLLVLLTALLSFAGSCLGAGDEIKQRMMERLPIITGLKARGVVGENRAGLLEFRSDKRQEAALIEAENADRRTVYTTIARQQGVDPGLVGARRALQIAEQAPPGTWLQKADGSWYQK